MHIVWLRNDLRLEDNPALYHGSTLGNICCVYVLTPKQWQAHQDAPAKIAFWRSRISTLSSALKTLNISLHILVQDSYTQVPQALLTLAQALQAQSLSFNNEYPVNEKHRDEQTTALFERNHLAVHRFDGDIVIPSHRIKTLQNGNYKVFTPFSRQWHKQLTENDLQLLPAPSAQPATAFNTHMIDIPPLATWGINKNTIYRDDLWPTHDDAIHQRLHQFCRCSANPYKEQRDIPSINGTSTLSPYLAAGMISVRQCIAAIRHHVEDWRSNQWVTELIWREFYRYLIDLHPHLSQSKDFTHIPKPIPWVNDDALFRAWCEGKTGFPIVDAAMKQLLQTGWMHNRLRMVTAAFLTKILLIDWRKGEAFFMQHLLDGDYASNNGGWQWAASTGADAAPYFRIFNPERQSERFDKEGIFIKKLLPELAPINAKNIHTPPSDLRLAHAYPEPIIDYKWARQRALDSYATAMGKA